MTVSKISADHASHDELLLAALASGDDLPADSRSRADALVRDCPDCAALVADLLLIRSATAALPVSPRRRDFRLTDADAERLRPAAWRRIVAAFGSARLAFATPLASGLVAIGVIAGIVTLMPGTAAQFAATSGAGDSALPFTASGMGSSGPGSASGVRVPEVAPVPVASGERAVPAPSLETGTLVQGGPAAAQVESPPAPASPAADLAASPPASMTKLPGNAAALVPAPGASTSPLPPEAAGGAALAQPSPAAAAGAPEAPAPSTAPAPVNAEAGTASPGTSWLTIASLVLITLGILLLGLRFAATRVLGR